MYWDFFGNLKIIIMDLKHKECFVENMSDKFSAHKELIESFRKSIEKYFFNFKILGADRLYAFAG